MRRAGALLCLVLAAHLVGCDTVSEVLPSPAFDCDRTESTLCAEVARVAVSRMNPEVMGPITGVTLTLLTDCDRVARSHFLSQRMKLATGCWEVAVIGERSRGGGIVWVNADGTIEAGW